MTTGGDQVHADEAWQQRHERHRELAGLTVRAGEAGEPLDDLVERVADMLDDFDGRRVAVEAVGAAYRRGYREGLRAVREELLTRAGGVDEIVARELTSVATWTRRAAAWAPAPPAVPE